MTAARAVLAAARAAGVTLEAGGADAIRARPKAALTSELIDAIKANKRALLALLDDPLAAFLDADLYQHRGLHEFTAPAWGPGVFYLVQGPQAALQVEGSGVAAGRILCACHVLDWRLSDLSVVAQAEAARRRLSDDSRGPCDAQTPVGTP